MSPIGNYRSCPVYFAANRRRLILYDSFNQVVLEYITFVCSKTNREFQYTTIGVHYTIIILCVEIIRYVQFHRVVLELLSFENCVLKSEQRVSIIPIHPSYPIYIGTNYINFVRLCRTDP